MSQVDHINCDKADNRWANLREATPSQNAGNCGPHRRNTSGCKGVTWHAKRKRWQAQLGGHYLGFYQSLDDAAKAYAEAATLHFGEFARL